MTDAMIVAGYNELRGYANGADLYISVDEYKGIFEIRRNSDIQTLLGSCSSLAELAVIVADEMNAIKKRT